MFDILPKHIYTRTDGSKSTTINNSAYNTRRFCVLASHHFEAIAVVCSLFVGSQVSGVRVEMFNFFSKTTKKPMKGYKITTADRKQKYGVAADSLRMLVDKAAAKLKVSRVIPRAPTAMYGEC